MTYFGSFSNYQNMLDSFAIGNRPDRPADREILFASYGGGSYDGDALVIFSQNNKLFEVHGSHCSCNGLDDQWAPEETTWDALFFRTEKAGKDFLYDHDPEAVKAFIELVLTHLQTQYPKTEVEEEL